MVKPSEVKTNHITSEMLDRAHCCTDMQTGLNYYIVESSQFANNQTEYKVTWSREFGFSCTCKSGQFGFANTRYGFCSHVAIAVAAAREERATLAAIAAKQPPLVLASVAIEEKWGLPSWMLTTRVAPSMKCAPAEK